MFEDVDLQDDFAEYDGSVGLLVGCVEKADMAVSIMEMEWRFEWLVCGYTSVDDISPNKQQQ